MREIKFNYRLSTRKTFVYSVATFVYIPKMCQIPSTRDLPRAAAPPRLPKKREERYVKFHMLRPSAADAGRAPPRARCDRSQQEAAAR